MDCRAPRPRLISLTRRAGVAALLAVTLSGLVACGPRGPRPSGAYPEFVAATLEAHDDGSFKKGRLRAAADVEGLFCEGWVHRYPGGTPRYLRLAAPAPVAGHAVPRGTEVFFASTGAVETLALPVDTVIDGHLCRGGVKVHTSLYPTGRLRAFFSRDDTVVDGVPCSGSLFHPLRLHEGGRLAECRVAARTTVDGVEVAAGTVIRLDGEGALLGYE